MQLPDMPTGLTYLALRPLMLPLALVCLVLGFVLWRFMGDLPSVLAMGIRILIPAPKQPAAEAAPPAPPVEGPAVDPVVLGLRAISVRDQTFDAAAFLASVRDTATRLAKGWGDKNLEPCRSLLSDDCYELQKAQMDRGLADGWRVLAGDVTFADGQIVAAAANDQGDGITVRVEARCAPEAMRVVRGRTVEAWVEDWLFRRTLTLTPPEHGVRRQIVRRGEWRVIRMDHVAIHYQRAA